MEHQTESSSDKELKTQFEALYAEPDILANIFSFLEPETLEDARLVCHDWERSINPLMKWEITLYDDPEKIKVLLEFLEKEQPIHLLQVSLLKDFLYPEEGLGFKAPVIKLEFLPFVFIPTKCEGISDINLRRLLKDLRNVKEMQINSRSFNDVAIPSPFSNFDFPNIEQLKVSTLDQDGPGYHVALDFLSNTFPMLKKLAVLIIYGVEGKLVEIVEGIAGAPQKYNEIYRFIARHRDTLEDLKVEHCTDYDPLESELKLIQERGASTEVQKLAQQLRSLRLKRLGLKITDFEGTGRFMFAQTLIENQDRLTSLKIGPISRANLGLLEILRSTVVQCSKTLVRFHCYGCTCTDAWPQPFACEIFRHCDKLEILELPLCGMKFSNVKWIPKTIKSLNLADQLTGDEINWMIENCKSLEKVSLLQSRHSINPRTVPKVTLQLFNLLLSSLEKLKLVSVLKKNSQWKKINRKIRKTKSLGLTTLHVDEELNLEEEENGIRHISIDRSQKL